MAQTSTIPAAIMYSAHPQHNSAPIVPSLSNRVSPTMPRAIEKLHILSDAALKTGCHVVAGPGSGKSRMMGRLIAWQALARGKPIIVLDPTGGIVSNVIDKIRRLPLEARRRLWSRIIYVDVGATDHVVPAPLYYQLSPTDTLFAIANRFPAVLKRQDPHLQSAPILGWNSLQECAIYSGQIAAALGRQLDFVADLIDHPRHYKEQLRQVLTDHPELEQAVSYFRELMDPNSNGLRERRTGSFRNKLLPFLSDPTMLAAFAAPTRTLDWDAVVEQKQIVLLDFQNELDPERRQFKLIWWFRSLIDYVKQRGLAGRGREIFFLVDEITQLLGYRSGEGNSILAEDLEELVAVLARNYGVNVVLAHQNLSQVDERVRNILMQCGTQIIGNITNPDDALYLARQFFHYRPFWVKKQEPVWMSVQHMDLMDRYSVPEIIDHRDVEFTPDEQLLMAMEKFRLPRFQFLVRAATAEGTIANQLHRISIENLDRNQYPEAQQVNQVLSYLRQRCGIPLETLLAEIRGQRIIEKSNLSQKQVKSDAPPAILSTNSPPSYDTNEPLSADPDTVVSVSTAAASDGGVRRDTFWQ